MQDEAVHVDVLSTSSTRTVRVESGGAVTSEMPDDPFGEDELASDHALELHDELLRSQGAGHSRESAFERLLEPDSAASSLFDGASDRARDALGFLATQVQDLVRAGFTEAEAFQLVLVVLGVHSRTGGSTVARDDGDVEPIPPPAIGVRDQTQDGWERLVTLEGVGSGQSLPFVVPKTSAVWSLRWSCGPDEGYPAITVFRVRGAPNRNAALSDPMIATMGDVGLRAGHAFVNETGRFYLKCRISDWWRVDIEIKQPDRRRDRRTRAKTFS